MRSLLAFLRTHIRSLGKSASPYPSALRLRLEILEDRVTPAAYFLDPAFGSSGKVTTSFGPSSEAATAMAMDGNGKIVAVGYSSNGFNLDFALARYNANGTLDPSFGSGGTVTTDLFTSDDIATSVAIDGNGKIVVAGQAGRDFAVARYNADGTLDPSFGSGGKVATDLGSTMDYATSVAIGNGKIVVAGYLTVGSTRNIAVVRYNDDGNLDTSFGSDGKVTTDFAFKDDSATGVAIDGNGKIVVAGYSFDASTSRFVLVRYDDNGSLDTFFGSGGKVTTAFGSSYDAAFCMALDGNGKIVVAGQSSAGSFDFALARYNADGNLDSTFGSGGLVTTDFGAFRDDSVTGVAVDGNGRIVVAGYSSYAPPFGMMNRDLALARYNADGSPDASFDSDGKLLTELGSLNDTATGMGLDSDGGIVVAGHTFNGAGGDEFIVARYRAASLRVTADPDTAGDQHFGTYLSGVRLPTRFTVTVTHPVGITRVRFQVDATTPHIAGFSSTAGTVITFDPGRLAAGDHTLTVVGLNAAGEAVVDPYVRTIKVIDHLPLDVDVDLPGNGRFDASKLRLVQGVVNVPNLNFIASTVGLPLPAAYANRLAVSFVDRRTGREAFQRALTFASDKATFSVPHSAFRDTVTAQSGELADYYTFLTPAKGFSHNVINPRRLGTDAMGGVFVIARPGWLAKAGASYTADAGIQDVLGVGTAGYAFKVTLASVSLPLPTTAGTPFKLFDGLKSSLSSGLDVIVYARLTGEDGDAVLRVGDWRLKLILLGTPLLPKPLSPAENGLTVGGTVDARTLDGLESLTFSTTQNLDVLRLLGTTRPTIVRTFGDGKNGTRPWKITGGPVPVPYTGGLLSLSATFFLKGAFRAALDSLTAGASLTFDFDSAGTPVFNRAASWVQFGVKADAELMMHAEAGLSVSSPVLHVFGGPALSREVFRVNLQGSVDMKVEAMLRVTFDQGLDRANSYAGLNAGYDLKYAIGVLETGEPDLEPFAKDSLEPVALFGLALPPSWV